MAQSAASSLSRAAVPGAAEDPPKFRYIDAARGAAILLVILVHTSHSVPRLNPWVWEAANLGQMGVQLFFVASALTLCLSAGERGFAARGQVRNFYVRRFFRIAPLYYAGIVFYNARGFGHGNVAPGTIDFGLSRRMLANLFFVHGLIPSANDNVVPGGWSIGTEMLFYAIFPLLFWAVTGRRRAVMFFALSLGFALAYQFLSCAAAGRPAFVENNSFAYYLIINQLPVFACGFILAYMPASQKPVLDFAAAFAFLLTMAWFSFHSKFGLAFVLVPALAGLGFLYFIRALAALRLNGLPAKAVAELGKKSFSIYIIHFIFAWDISRECVPTLRHYQVRPDVQLVLLSAFTVLASYLLACVSGRLLEAPGVRLGKSLIARLSRPAASGA